MLAAIGLVVAGAGLYCGVACARRSQRNRQQFACERCGNLFDRRPGELKKSQPRFCSHACRDDRHRSLAERFWEKVDRSGGPDACWLWRGYKAHWGYGVMSQGKGGRALAHRLAYALTRGPIPHGLFVCHHCDNPPCVNPSHLFLGTPADNTADMIAKGRIRPSVVPAASRRRGSRHQNAVLNEELVAQLRQRFADRPPNYLRLSRELDIPRVTLQYALTGVSWRHVAQPPVPRRARLR